jgi:hypothetical protein
MAIVITANPVNIYSVGDTVGPHGCRNNRLDVMLVQYLLKHSPMPHHWTDSRGAGDDQILAGYLGPPPAPDGVFGPKTHYAILAASVFGMTTGYLRVAPGFVGPHIIGRNTPNERTLGHFINHIARVKMGEKRFNGLVDEPDMSPELRTHLKEKLRLDSLGDKRGIPAN